MSYDLYNRDFNHDKKITSFTQYIHLAQRTNSTANESTEKNHLHCLVGLLGELHELGREIFRFEMSDVVNKPDFILSELGDVLWYLFNAIGNIKGEYYRNKFTETTRYVIDKLTKDRNSFSPTYTVNDAKDLVIDHLEDFKKVFFYGKEIDLNYYINQVSNLIYSVMYLAYRIISDYYKSEDNGDDIVTEDDFFEIMTKNILKLKARYSDKFDLNESNNRSYEKESEASGLEGN